MIHLAAKSDVAESVSNPETVENVNGTINVLNSCVKNKIKKWFLRHLLQSMEIPVLQLLKSQRQGRYRHMAQARCGHFDLSSTGSPRFCSKDCILIFDIYLKRFVYSLCICYRSKRYSSY